MILSIPIVLHIRVEAPEGPADQVLEAYNGLVAQRCQDFTPAWPDVRTAIQGNYARTFDAEGAVEAHQRWASLSENYARWKQRHYPGQPILSLTGALRSHLAGGFPPPDEDIAAHSYTLTSALSTPSGYDLAGLHQLGTHRMPARPPARLTSSLFEEVCTVLRRYILGGVQGD